MLFISPFYLFSASVSRRVCTSLIFIPLPPSILIFLFLIGYLELNLHGLEHYTAIFLLLIHTRRLLYYFCRLQICNEMIVMTPKIRQHPQNSFHQLGFCEILDYSPYSPEQNNHTDKYKSIFRNKFLKQFKDGIVDFSEYVFRQIRNRQAALKLDPISKRKVHLAITEAAK